MQSASGAGSWCWWIRSARWTYRVRRAASMATWWRLIFAPSSTNTGIRQRRAQLIHRSRASLPSSPLTENTWRKPSLSRYARCRRGSVSGDPGQFLRLTFGEIFGVLPQRIAGTLERAGPFKTRSRSGVFRGRPRPHLGSVRANPVRCSTPGAAPRPCLSGPGHHMKWIGTLDRGPGNAH